MFKITLVLIFVMLLSGCPLGKLATEKTTPNSELTATFDIEITQTTRLDASEDKLDLTYANIEVENLEGSRFCGTDNCVFKTSHISIGNSFWAQSHTEFLPNEASSIADGYIEAIPEISVTVERIGEHPITNTKVPAHLTPTVQSEFSGDIKANSGFITFDISNQSYDFVDIYLVRDYIYNVKISDYEDNKVEYNVLDSGLIEIPIEQFDNSPLTPLCNICFTSFVFHWQQTFPVSDDYEGGNLKLNYLLWTEIIADDG